MKKVLLIFLVFLLSQSGFSQTTKNSVVDGVWHPYAIKYRDDTVLVKYIEKVEELFKQSASDKYPSINIDSLAPFVSIISTKAHSRALDVAFYFKSNNEFWINFLKEENSAPQKFGKYQVKNSSEVQISFDSVKTVLKFRISSIHNQKCLIWEDNGFTYFFIQ